MKLSQHDLQQLDEDAVRRLPEEALRHLSLTLLADLKEARERLAQHPRNSSRPPSSRALDTCRQRGHSPWTYLVTAIADRRAGLPLAPLPQPGV